MTDIEKKQIGKYREEAMKWYKTKKTGVPAELDVVEEKSCEQELRMVAEVKAVVEKGDLGDRGAVITGVLSSVEKELKRGRMPQNLPHIITNLAKKPEIGNEIIEITKKYSVSGSSYYYLWGLNAIEI